MEGIEISQGRVGTRRDVAMMIIKGYVDTMTCSILLNKITENLNSSIFHMIVDMAQVNYVSSAGWGVFVGEIKGIREKGGDLKIVQMTPEVYDVFEMLEFNRILSYYESIEEAINDFDISIGLDITKSASRASPVAEENVEAPSLNAVDRTALKVGNLPRPGYAFEKQKIDNRMLPLTEKVKRVVIKDPTLGLFKIQKVLRSKEFGPTEITLIRLYRMLRKLNLEDKNKRYRFYRSR